MNSDPHDSAAWRAFGMLDADESAGFDEAMRLDPDLRAAYGEISRLSAAVAASTVVPVAPRPGQLEQLQRRLGIGSARRINWPGITGWAAAIALGAILCIKRDPPAATTVRHDPAPAETNASPHAADSPAAEIDTQDVPTGEGLADHPPASALPAETYTPVLTETDAKAIAKLDARRLIQEIEILREELEGLQDRDRQRMEPVPGMAWPIVMRMSPPEFLVGPSYGTALVRDDPPFTEVLGDALREAGVDDGGAAAGTGLVHDEPAVEQEPSATPIYDAARDTGTLVVNNLPAAAEGEVYNLWVTTSDGQAPVYVGRLPKPSGTGSDTFDFSLGGAAVVPTGFMLTRDPAGRPQPPADTNTVLIGPK